MHIMVGAIQQKNKYQNYGINNINGLIESTKTFWRDKTKRAPHNAVTSTEQILEVAERRGYRTTSDKKSVLNYTTDEVLLEEGTEAIDITIPYSTLKTVKYKYDEETKRYTRYSNNTKQTDWNTEEDITTKNIIITFAENHPVKSGSILQELKNIGTLKGYYITNGKAIEITCEKVGRNSQTIYKDLKGNEIKVNDGNTFVQICPISAKVSFLTGDQVLQGYRFGEYIVGVAQAKRPADTAMLLPNE